MDQREPCLINLQQVVQHLHANDGADTGPCVLRTSAQAFVCACSNEDDYHDGILSQLYPAHTSHFYILLRFNLHNLHAIHELVIYGVSLRDSIACLKYLVGLRNDHYQMIRITHMRHENEHPRLVNLERWIKFLLDSLGRPHQIVEAFFDPKQSQMLQAPRSVEFNYPLFQDDEIPAFSMSSTINGKIAFEQSDYTHFNSLSFACVPGVGKLQALELWCEVCSVDLQLLLSSGNTIERLFLKFCRFPDHDESVLLLCQALSSCCPRCLSIIELHDENESNLFRSLKNWLQFVNFLKGYTRLKGLNLMNIQIEGDLILPLARTLRENVGLTDLSLSEMILTPDGFHALVSAISVHPTIISLSLTEMIYQGFLEDEPAAIMSRTVQLVEMVQSNPRVQHLTLCPDTCDENIRETDIEPLLKCRRFRSRCMALARCSASIETRAAMCLKILARFASVPSFIFLALTANIDAICVLLNQMIERP